MSSSVTIEYQLSELDVARAARAHFGSWKRLFIDIMIALALIEIGLWFGADKGYAALFGIVAAMIGAIFLLMLLWAFVFMPKAAMREPRYQSPFRLTFSEEGIEFRTSDLESRLQWSLYGRALRANGCWLLYHMRDHYSIIPLRAFARDEDRKAFEALVETHVAKIERR